MTNLEFRKWLEQFPDDVYIDVAVAWNLEQDNGDFEPFTGGNSEHPDSTWCLKTNSEGSPATLCLGAFYSN